MKSADSPHRNAPDIGDAAMFGLATLATIAITSYGLFLSGAGVGTWLRNPAAWLAGAILAAPMLAAGYLAATSKAVIALAMTALAATLVSPAQSSVHRWVGVGPLYVNVAALLLPACLVALGRLNSPAATHAVAVTIGITLVAQPDASQATAFLLAAGFLVYRADGSGGLRIARILALALLLVAAWLRPDRLQPVPEVEGIIPLLAGVSPVLALLAAVGLAVCSLLPLRRARIAGAADAVWALVIYFVAIAGAPAVGAFPVPLVGVGMSFPIGYWLAVALLCATSSKTSNPAY